MLFREAPRTVSLVAVLVLVYAGICIVSIVTTGWDAVWTLLIIWGIYAAIHFALKWAARKDDLA